MCWRVIFSLNMSLPCSVVCRKDVWGGRKVTPDRHVEDQKYNRLDSGKKAIHRRGIRTDFKPGTEGMLQINLRTEGLISVRMEGLWDRLIDANYRRDSFGRSFRCEFGNVLVGLAKGYWTG